MVTCALERADGHIVRVWGTNIIQVTPGDVFVGRYIDHDYMKFTQPLVAEQDIFISLQSIREVLQRARGPRVA